MGLTDNINEDKNKEDDLNGYLFVQNFLNVLKTDKMQTILIDKMSDLI